MMFVGLSDAFHFPTILPPPPPKKRGGGHGPVTFEHFYQ